MALPALLLLGCASGQKTDDEYDESSGRRAAEVNTQLGSEYMSRGQFEIALDKLKRAIRADDSYAPAHTVIAVLYERIGEEDLAETHYRRAVKASPDNGDVNNNLGTFLCRNGEGSKALPHFEKALDDPFYRTPEVAMANAGSCALDMGELELASDYLRISLRYDDSFPDALIAMASVNYALDDLLRTRAFLQRYESTGSVSPQGLMLGYRLETSAGDASAARRYHDQLLQRFPSSAEADELVGRRGRS
jgi:type IV pilus assembly protein PilF